jgi:O-acetyl-ADP-ribose deacetylase (regulator of RNase III)
MQWRLRRGNVWSEPADAVIVTAHPFLNLAGGAGAQLLNRQGQAIQTELHYHLQKIGARYLQPTDVAPTFGGDVPYRVVLHAVALDAFYDSSADWIAATLANALALAVRYEARTVSAVALATGYGQLPLEAFASGLRAVASRPFPPLEQFTLCVRDSDKFTALTALLPEFILLDAPADDAANESRENAP